MIRLTKGICFPLIRRILIFLVQPPSTEKSQMSLFIAKVDSAPAMHWR